ncbi:hypothetical protein HXV88_10645 [Aeromonas veronii]|uniref:hypothetical protein n=1 Tax=Aeromonas veronii TaxID=654 RepID=UPI0015D06F07|nr:hypothetical protein [Aeromonas veronii]QLH66864.1 hypothetical protein HXV88_10595 [Aeromonas veronii]QLH66874.1 hypothetical protein HXV88_10645 [Aeromonas veronii]
MTDNLEQLHTTYWFVQKMNLGLSKINAMHPPADTFELQLYYGLYFESLLSLIDYFGDKDDRIRQEFHSALLPVGGVDKNPNTYIRELRNGVVHRGLSITGRGSVLDGIVRLHLPPQVPLKKSGYVTAPDGFKYVHEVIDFIENTYRSVLLAAFERMKMFDLPDDAQAEKAHTAMLDAFKQTDQIPEELKSLVKPVLNELDMKEILSSQIEHLRQAIFIVNSTSA